MSDTEPIYYEITDFPSKCKLYGNVKIEGRPLKLLEVKRLSSMTEENADSIILDILKKCIRGIKIEDILSSDKLFLIFWLRANTYRESGYSQDFVCSNCKEEVSFDFKLSNLQVQYLKDSFSLANLTFKTKNEDEIVFHFPKIIDEKRLKSFKTAYLPIYKDLDDEIAGMAVSIDKINGKELELIEKYEYLINQNPENYCYILSKMEEWNFGIKSELLVECPKCGGTTLKGVTFREEFFLPKYKSN